METRRLLPWAHSVFSEAVQKKEGEAMKKEFWKKNDSYIIIGFNPNAASAKITLEFSECEFWPESFLKKKEDEVCKFLVELHKKDLKTNERYSLRFGVTRGVAPYASIVNENTQGGIAPVFYLSTDMDPVYHKDMNLARWVDLVEQYARQLGERFNRPNLKVSYSGEGISVLQGKVLLNEVA